MPLTHIATPVAMPIMASVVRKDGMPTRVVSRPFASPTDNAGQQADDNAERRARTASIPMAVVTEASPATAPTERSISPATRTNVIATAMIEIIAVWRMMFSRLFGSRKPWSSG